MNDLWSAAAEIGDHAEKLVHAHVVSGFLRRLALGGRDRPFIRFEFALRQYPCAVPAALDDRNPRPGAVANDNATSRKNRHSCRFAHAGFITDSIRRGHSARITLRAIRRQLPTLCCAANDPGDAEIFSSTRARTSTRLHEVGADAAGWRARAGLSRTRPPRRALLLASCVDLTRRCPNTAP